MIEAGENLGEQGELKGRRKLRGKSWCKRKVPAASGACPEMNDGTARYLSGVTSGGLARGPWIKDLVIYEAGERIPTPTKFTKVSCVILKH
ncbi:hypothetical protein M0804_014015 [Polistes exclamans]|nr:hypothetical protein M0804_014019 [Polistes exclamans]KAI4475905.1 hypothetical protein M0804_014015 [Polistes exclamans]